MKVLFALFLVISMFVGCSRPTTKPTINQLALKYNDNNCEESYIDIDYKTGNVTFHNITPDKASRMFWESIETAYPEFRKVIIEDYKKNGK